MTTTALSTTTTDEKTLTEIVRRNAVDFLAADPGALHAIQAAFLHEVRRAPKLFSCDPDSMAAAAVTCSELRLYPTGAGAMVHLIPRDGQVTVNVGYRGLIELGRRSGAHLDADGVVYADEIAAGLFEASLAPFHIAHRFSLEEINRHPDQVVAAYATCTLVDGARVGVILTRGDIDHRRSKAFKGGETGAWVTDYPAMARKSAIRALYMGGKVPLSGPVLSALATTDDLWPARPAPTVPVDTTGTTHDDDRGSPIPPSPSDRW